MPNLNLSARLALGAIMLCCVTVAKAAGAAGVAADIDRYLKERFPADKPGVAVIVVKEGKVVFRKGYGMADLELQVPVQADMVFRIGSVSKQFTAAAILMLEQQGKLSVDDDIRRFLPDFPHPGQPIAIGQLLNHTAGIPAFWDGYLAKGKIREDVTTAELYEIIKSQPLEFEPGTRWSYSDGGYELLGMIIEKASGLGYAAFIEQHIFQPLGMRNSYYDTPERIIPKRVKGYMPAPDGYKNADYISMTLPYSAGALASSVGDLALWDAAINESDKLLNGDARRRMTTSYVLKDGAQGIIPYGFGVGLQSRRGEPRIFHTGQINGFRSAVLRWPRERLFVAVLSNDDGLKILPELVTERVAAIAAGKPYPEAATVKLAPAVLDAFVGQYRFDAKPSRGITREGTRLFMQRTNGPKVELLPVSATEFIVKDSFNQIRFVKGPDGRTEKLVLVQSYGPAREENKD